VAVNVNIVLRPDESLDSALQRFKRAVNRSDVLGELKRRAVFVASAERERRKHFKAVAMVRRKQQRRNADRP